MTDAEVKKKIDTLAACWMAIEMKLDLLGRAIGGDSLVVNWNEIERITKRPVRARTFDRKRVNRAQARLTKPKAKTA